MAPSAGTAPPEPESIDTVIQRLDENGTRPVTQLGTQDRLFLRQFFDRGQTNRYQSHIPQLCNILEKQGFGVTYSSAKGSHLKLQAIAFHQPYVIKTQPQHPCELSQAPQPTFSIPIDSEIQGRHVFTTLQAIASHRPANPNDIERLASTTNKLKYPSTHYKYGVQVLELRQLQTELLSEDRSTQRSITEAIRGPESRENLVQGIQHKLNQVPADFTPTPSDTNRPNVTAMGAIAVSGAQDHLGTASEVLETAIEHSDRMNEIASTIAEGINLARQIATFGLSLLD